MSGEKDLNNVELLDEDNTRGGRKQSLPSINTKGGREQSLPLVNIPCRRLMIFIDGGNLFHGAKAVGVDLDFGKLIKFLSEGYDLIRVYYYTGVPTLKVWNREKESRKVFERKQNRQKSFLDNLSYEFNVDVVAKSLVLMGGKIVEKGIDVRIASDIIWHGLSDNYDSFILLSGDKDLMDCLIRMKDNGKKVIVANFEDRVSRELKRIADCYINLSENLEEIRK